MVETLKYSKLFVPDLDIGEGAKQVQLVDGRVVLLDQVHQSSLLLQKTQELRATNGESSLTASALLPSNSRVIGVTVKVLVTLGQSAGLTGFHVGWNELLDHWGQAIALLEGTKTTFGDFQSRDEPVIGATAQDVIITAAAGTFDGTGRIEIKTWYDRLIH